MSAFAVLQACYGHETIYLGLHITGDSKLGLKPKTTSHRKELAAREETTFKRASATHHCD